MVVTLCLVTGSQSGSRAGSQEEPAVPKTIGQIIPDELDAKIREMLQDKVATLF